MKSKTSFRNFLLAAGSSLLSVASASAQTNYFWDQNGATGGTGGTGSWNATDNFWRTVSDTGTLGIWTSSDTSIAIFGGTAGTVTLTSAITAGGLTFNTNGYTITGGTLTLAGTSAPIINVTTGTTTISSIIAGTNGLQKNGGGTLSITTNPTYTGATILNGGTLDVSTLGTPLSSSSGITFTGTSIFRHIGGSSATLPSAQINTGVTGAYRSGDSGSGSAIFTIPSITGSGTFSAENSSTGQGKTWAITNLSSFTGRLQLNGASATVVRISNINDTVANNIIFTGNAGGSGAGAQNTLNYVGSSGLTLTNRAIQIAHSGNSFVALNNNGTSNSSLIINSNLNISGSTGTKTLYLGGTNTGGTSTFAGTLVNGNSTVSLTKRDVNTWSLSNASNSYTGGTNISGGTLGFASGALGSSGAINASGGTLRWLPGNTQDISNRLAFTAAATSTFDTNGNDVTFASAIGSSTTGNFVKTGLGTLTLQGTNTFTSGTKQLNGGGTLVLDYTTNDNRKLSTGALTLAGGTIVLKGGTTTAESASSTIFNTSTAGTFFVRDGGTAKINLNAFTVGISSTVSFSHDSMATTDRTNVGGILGAWFTVGNRWASNSTNVADGDIVGYTGATTLNLAALPDGALSPDINYNLAGGGTLTASRQFNTLRIESTADNQVLNLGANTLSVSNLTGTNAPSSYGGGLLYAGGVNGNYTITGTTGRVNTENGNGQSQLINVHSGMLTLDAVVGAGTSAFVKSGEGTLVFNKANGYTGATRVYQGVLRLTGAGSLTAGTTVQDGAAIELGNGIAVANTSTLNITGTGISNGGALRNVATTSSSYAAAITIGAGGARINSDSGTLTLTGGVVTAGNTVTFGGAGNTTVSTAAISGTGGLIKDGAGTTTLSFAHTYTGATRITAGALRLGSGGTVGRLTATSAIINNGNLTINRSNAFSQATDLGAGVAITGNGSFTQAGAGTTTLTAVNTYTGATSVNAGTLNIASGGSTHASSAVTVSNSGSALIVNGTVGGSLLMNANTTLSGTGTITGNATIAGNHNPGNSPGIQSFGGDLSYSGGTSAVQWELNDNAISNSPVVFDQIIVSGNLDFTDLTTMNLVFNGLGSAVDWNNALWASNQSWTIYDVAGTTTNFNNLQLTSIDWLDSNGLAYSSSPNAGGTFALGQNGQDVVLNYTAYVIPEPKAVLLGCLGVLLLLRRRR